MSRKHTYEEVKRAFSNRQWELLSSEYVRANHKLRFRCNEGHLGEIRWNDFQQGVGCAECSGKKRLTINKVREEFLKCGYIVLDDNHVTAYKRLNCLCPSGHDIQLTWNSFNRGQRCRICAYDKLKTPISEVISEFSKRGLTVTSGSYVNARTKIQYRCAAGHKSSMTWSSFQKGCGCPYCDDDQRRTDIESIKKEFKDLGFMLLEASDYRNCRSKITYECPQGHITSSTLTGFRNAKVSRCKICEEERRKTSGSQHRNWNPNISDEERHDRRIFTEYPVWRKAVYERDLYTCQICHSRGGKINAHHLDSYHANEELRTDLNNGVTLCKYHHDDFHKRYGRKYNTREQFEEYVDLMKKNNHALSS